MLTNKPVHDNVQLFSSVLNTISALIKENDVYCLEYSITQHQKRIDVNAMKPRL